MLPGWYSHVRKQHPYTPIAFGDFGMSEDAKQWCQERGTLIEASKIPSYLPPPLHEIGWLYNGKKWTCKNTAYHPDRFVFFRKPYLMQQSPFDRTIWLDLDCQVLKSLKHLVSIPLSTNQFAICIAQPKHRFFMRATEDLQKKLQPETIAVLCYNSGVVVFEKKSPLLDVWSYLVTHAGHNFGYDDHVLSFAINYYHFNVTLIPSRYNWPIHCRPNANAAVIHWMKDAPKHALRLIYR